MTNWLYPVLSVVSFALPDSDLAHSYNVSEAALRHAGEIIAEQAQFVCKARSVFLQSWRTVDPELNTWDPDFELLRFMMAKIPDHKLFDHNKSATTLLAENWGVSKLQELETASYCPIGDCRRRLERLIQGDTTVPYGQGNQSFSFDSFFAAFPQQALYDNQSWLFFRDHPDVQGKDVEKLKVSFVQTYGVCGLVAASVFQHYHHILRSNQNATPVYRITKVAETLRLQELAVVKGHVFFDEGRSAIEAAKALCHNEEDDYVYISLNLLLAGLVDAGNLKALLYKMLVESGPGLISGFHVSNDFMQAGVFSFTGKAHSKGTSHAMLLIGTRMSASNDRMFLLQNWWRQKQFVEVTLEYLASALQGGQIAFLKPGSTCAAPELLSSSIAMAVETSSDGGGDKTFLPDY